MDGIFRKIIFEDCFELYEYKIIKESLTKEQLEKKQKSILEIIETIENYLSDKNIDFSENQEISFRDQLIESYSDKYPLPFSKGDIECIIDNTLKSFNENGTEILRKQLVDNLEKEIFTDENTYFFNEKMSSNIPLIIEKPESFKKLINYMNRFLIWIISRKMDAKFLKKFEIEEQGKTINLEEQLLARYHKNFYEFSVKKFICFLAETRRLNENNKFKFFSELDNLLFPGGSYIYLKTYSELKENTSPKNCPLYEKIIKESLTKEQLDRKQRNISEIIGTIENYLSDKKIDFSENQEISFRDQLIESYSDKYPLPFSKGDIECIIDNTLKSFNENGTEILRKQLVDNLEKEIFINKNTYFFNEKMSSNIPLIIEKPELFKNDINYMNRFLIWIISRKMDAKFLKKFEIEEQGKTINLEEQLLARYHKSLYWFSIRKFIYFLIKIRRLNENNKFKFFSELDNLLFPGGSYVSNMNSKQRVSSYKKSIFSSYRKKKFFSWCLYNRWWALTITLIGILFFSIIFKIMDYFEIEILEIAFKNWIK